MWRGLGGGLSRRSGARRENRRAASVSIAKHSVSNLNEINGKSERYGTSRERRQGKKGLAWKSLPGRYFVTFSEDWPRGCALKVRNCSTLEVLSINLLILGPVSTVRRSGCFPIRFGEKHGRFRGVAGKFDAKMDRQCKAE